MFTSTHYCSLSGRKLLVKPAFLLKDHVYVSGLCQRYVSYGGGCYLNFYKVLKYCLKNPM